MLRKATTPPRGPAPGAHAAPADFYCAKAYRSDDSIGWLMKRVLNSIVSQVDKRLVTHDLTSAQWGPLLHLQMQGRCTVADLARRMQMDAGAMTRLLDRLEKKQLLKRVRCTEDRRVVQVDLTPQGAAAIVEVPAVLAEVLNAHLAGFSKAEWQTLRSLLHRMLDTGESLRET